MNTSQNVTAPKLPVNGVSHGHGLNTSQNVTAPKLNKRHLGDLVGLNTSQNVTAPKPTPGIYALDGGKIKTVRATSVNGTFSLSAVSQSADWGKLATKYSNAEKRIRSKAVDAMTSAISQAKRQGKSHREVLRAGNKAGAKVYASWFKRAATKKSGFKFEYEE